MHTLTLIVEDSAYEKVMRFLQAFSREEVAIEESCPSEVFTPKKATAERKPGALKGKIHDISPDFDEEDERINKLFEPSE